MGRHGAGLRVGGADGRVAGGEVEGDHRGGGVLGGEGARERDGTDGVLHRVVSETRVLDTAQSATTEEEETKG